MQNYFDILPHSTGWIYVIGGMPSASYPSYALCLKAAHLHAERDRHRLQKPVFRRQELDGGMAPCDQNVTTPYPQIRP
ncbi:hypothetical protein J2T09_000697 [Neorhizobium huautlense]|uniref:Uncharacterized protein n=1 Tax=Neorhizobium huautlense TaxID=67774 RepID=A0ABT9PP35_9HYPH|nr:hypothetical protein [Neorhizobium huautlense]MDP9835955.1 hypothetical protein [Neorhizobium huautlense]